MPPSVSSRTSSPPAPSTSTVSCDSARHADPVGVLGDRRDRTPRRRAAVSGASGSSRAVNSWTAHAGQPRARLVGVARLVRRRRRSAPASRPRPSRRAARTASAAVATVLPTPVSVPVTTTTRPVTGCASTTLTSDLDGARPRRRRPTPALVVIRSREMPSGTDGGRKQPTRMPWSRHAACAASAACGEAIGTDSTAPAGRRHAEPVGQRRAPGRGPAPAARDRARSTASAASAAPAGAGASAVSKMKGRARVDEVLDQRRGSPSTAPPWLPSDFESVAVTTTWGCPASPRSRTSPWPPSATPSPCASSTTSSASCVARRPRPARPAAPRRRAPSRPTRPAPAPAGRRRPPARRHGGRRRCAAPRRSRARDSRAASISEACTWASETMSVSRSASAVTAARLAW